MSSEYLGNTSQESFPISIHQARPFSHQTYFFVCGRGPFLSFLPRSTHVTAQTESFFGIVRLLDIAPPSSLPPPNDDSAAAVLRARVFDSLPARHVCCPSDSRPSHHEKEVLRFSRRRNIPL